MRVGILDSLVQGAGALQDEARGRILREELRDTNKKLSGLAAEDELEAMQRFFIKQDRIGLAMIAWPRKEKLDLAETLRKSARQNLGVEVVEAYALWMAAAWLEAGERFSSDARYVHQNLSNCRRDYFAEIDPAVERLAAKMPLAGASDETLIGYAVSAIQALLSTRYGHHKEQLEVLDPKLRALICANPAYADRLALVAIGMARGFDLLCGTRNSEGLGYAFGAAIQFGVEKHRGIAVLDALLQGGPPLYSPTAWAPLSNIWVEGRMALLRAIAQKSTPTAILVTFGHLARYF
jgi:hypothetical protein